MNRRAFFKRAATGAAVLAAAPMILSEPFIPKPAYRTYVFGDQSVINEPVACEQPGGWVSYRFKYTAALAPNQNQRLRMVTMFRKDEDKWVKINGQTAS